MAVCGFRSVHARQAIVADAGQRYWSAEAERIFASLSPESPLFDQLSPRAFTHPFSPNWQDRSTQAECELFERAAGGGEALARITGSRAHHVSDASNPIPRSPSLGMAHFFLFSFFFFLFSLYSVSPDRRSSASTAYVPKYTAGLSASPWCLLFYVRSSLDGLPRSTSATSAA